MDQAKRLEKAARIGSFLIPFTILICISILADVYPFGQKTLLVSDLNNQYISFFAAYKALFTGDASVFYDFSKGMGGEMTGLFAYYLASPFNLIFVLFSIDKLPLAIHFVIILKIACSSLSMHTYLNRIHGRQLGSLIFSLAYALMGYNMSYFYNLMWLDVIILLPLVCVGLHDLIEKKKTGLYTISLSLAILSNYYIAFMLCIFLVLYFIYQCFLQNIHHNKRVFRSTIWRFLRSSILAALLISFMLAPLVFSLLGGKAQADITQNLSDLTARTLLKQLFPIWALVDGLIPSFAKLYPNTVTWQEVQTGRANIYIGLLPLVFVLLYFFNRQIQLKEKILSTILLAIFYWSVTSDILDGMWHGLNSPYWFPHRYSFLISFFMLVLAYRAFLYLKTGITKSKVLLVCGILLLFTLLIMYEGYDFLDRKTLLDSSIAMVLIGLILYVLLQKNLKTIYLRIALVLLVLVHLMDLSLNAWHAVTSLQAASSAKMDQYQSFVADIDPILDDIRLMDEGFYRVEKTFHRSLNDPMLLDYNGTSHYSSSEKDHVKAYLGHLGLRSHGTWAYYSEGSTMGADTLLGIRYLLTEDALSLKGYDLVREYQLDAKTYRLYKNTSALPLAMKLHGKADDISQMFIDEEDKSPFAKMNTIWHHLGDESTKAVYEGIPFKIRLENLRVEEVSSYTRYQKVDPSKDAFLHLEWTMDDDDFVYTYMTAPRFQDVDLILNGDQIGHYFAVQAWEAKALGQFKQGDTIRLSIKPNTNQLDMDEIFIETEDQVEMSRISKALNKDALDLKQASEASFQADVEIDETSADLLLINLPFDLGWHVSINGEALETKMVFNALMAVSLDGIDSGTHEIQFRFIPRGLKLGIFLTLTAVFIHILILLTQGKRST